MRPLAVLLLIVVAVGALVFALLSITGSSGAGEGSGTRVVQPAAPIAADEDRSGEAVSAYSEPVRVEAEVVEPDRTVVEGSGAFENEIYGTVSSPEGRPLQDAEVSLVRRKGPANVAALASVFAPQPTRPIKRTKTNKEGVYRFGRLQPASDYRVVVKHADYQRAEAGPVTVAEEGGVMENVRLKEGFKIFGYVRDHAHGGFIPNATISIDNPLTAQLPGNRDSGVRMVTTSDDAGYFEFLHVGKETKYLMCVAEGYGTYVDNSLEFPREMEHLSVQVDMTPEQVIGGRVVGADLSGLEGATVDAISYSSQLMSRGRAVTEADGSFLVRGLADGQYTLVIDAPGWGQKRVNRIDAGNRNVEVVMAELAKVWGRVVDQATGKGLSNFRVSVRMVNRDASYVGREAAGANIRDAENGVYEISGLAAGDYVVEASAKGYANTRSDPVTIEQGIDVPDVVVAMTRGGKVTGQLLDIYTGKPIQGARVMTQDNNWVESPFTDIFKGLVARNTTESQGRTDENGRFEFELLIPGAYQLLFEHPNYTTITKNDVRIFEGQTNEIGVLKMSHGAKVSGSVYLANGSPAAGVKVTMHAAVPSITMRSYTDRTNAEGRYVMSNVAAGNYKLSAARETQNQDNPFQVIVDMKQSEVDMTVVDGGEYLQDLYLGAD